MTTHSWSSSFSKHAFGGTKAGQSDTKVLMTRDSKLVKIVCLIAVLFFSATMLMAQGSDTATLRGTVKDPKGAVISNAKATLLDPAKNISRSAASNDQGDFVFSNVPPGAYQLKISSENFSNVATNVVL